jgi:hypothetical protein
LMPDLLISSFAEGKVMTHFGKKMTA